MKKIFRSVLWLLLCIASAILLARFLNENSETEQLQLLGWRTKEASKGFLILISFLTGFALSIFFLLSALVSRSLEVRRLRRENEALQRLAQPKNEATYSSSSKI